MNKRQQASAAQNEVRVERVSMASLILPEKMTQLTKNIFAPSESSQESINSLHEQDSVSSSPGTELLREQYQILSV